MKNLYLPFELSLNIFKDNSAPGLDKINYSIIKRLPQFFFRISLDIFNNILSSGLFPNQWRDYLIAFIPKNESSKVRPVALASCILKLTEKIINFRVTWFIENNNLSPTFQFGFRKNKSCIDNLTILINNINESFYKN